MKKIFLSFFTLFLLFAIPVSADTTPSISLSDAIYADLAIRNNLDNVSLYYADGKRDNDILLNENRHWLPASTVKTFAAMYAYKLINEGKLNLDDTVSIDAKNDVPTELVTDELPTLLEGDQVTINRLIRQMVTQSDNTAYNQLLDILGRDAITNYIVSLGLIHSHVGSKLNLDTSQEQYEYDEAGYGINTTTAEDYAKAFMLIKNNKIPGAKELYNVLKQQKINTMIPLFLPQTVTCAHKTGDLDPLYHDGGICQDKKQSYVLTIFTNAGDPNLLAHLSEIIYTKNYDLVGQSTYKSDVSKTQNTDFPLDPLVMNPPKNVVLGASTLNLPIPDITAADLGITSNDLSLTLKDTDLPHVSIPADSPFHFLSDIWQVAKEAFVVGPVARRNVDIETAKLRLAESKDLIKKGKTQEAKGLLQNLQQGLALIVNNPTIIHDSSAQNTIEAISETRFEVLKDALQKAKGQERLLLIKSIANQARDTIKKIQPYIPDAINAINPTQKPLIGEIIKISNSEITVRTSGGEQIQIATNSVPVIIKEKQTLLDKKTTTTTKLSSLTLGETVALIGSTTNNTFAPSIILRNIPKELAAPVPVTVAKVDIKHKTMVVIENGVYTQINITSNTSIKGLDTDIPLKAIKAGDVVIVHGEPLQKTPSKEIPEPKNVIPSAQNKTQSDNQTKEDNNTSGQSIKNTNSIQTANPSPGNNTYQPPVIQSTSVQVIEKKADMPKASPEQNPSTQSKPQNQPQKAPEAPPVPQVKIPTSLNKNDDKKK